MDKVIQKHYQHIDNGGVTISIVDRNTDGIVLVLEAGYHGHPSIKSEMRIDLSLPLDWLQKVGLMFIAASEDLTKIDWENRYNSPSHRYVSPTIKIEMAREPRSPADVFENPPSFSSNKEDYRSTVLPEIECVCGSHSGPYPRGRSCVCGFWNDGRGAGDPNS